MFIDGKYNGFDIDCPIFELLKILNLLDILYLIDYLYGSPTGPAPDPLDAGDANADGAVNLLDVLQLIDYLYGEPPPPELICP